MNFIVLNILFIIQYQIFYILDNHIQVFNFLLLLKQIFLFSYSHHQNTNTFIYTFLKPSILARAPTKSYKPSNFLLTFMHEFR